MISVFSKQSNNLEKFIYLRNYDIGNFFTILMVRFTISNGFINVFNFSGHYSLFNVAKNEFQLFLPQKYYSKNLDRKWRSESGIRNSGRYKLVSELVCVSVDWKNFQKEFSRNIFHYKILLMKIATAIIRSTNSEVKKFMMFKVISVFRILILLIYEKEWRVFRILMIYEK